jgi:hypothetical protein
MSLQFLKFKKARIEALPSAWVEGGRSYPRVDIGEARIFRDQPQDSIQQAFDFARAVAEEFDGSEVQRLRNRSATPTARRSATHRIAGFSFLAALSRAAALGGGQEGDGKADPLRSRVRTPLQD